MNLALEDKLKFGFQKKKQQEKKFLCVQLQG